jgi:hypothetical protein
MQLELLKRRVLESVPRLLGEGTPSACSVAWWTRQPRLISGVTHALAQAVPCAMQICRLRCALGDCRGRPGADTRVHHAHAKLCGGRWRNVQLPEAGSSRPAAAALAARKRYLRPSIMRVVFWSISCKRYFRNVREMRSHGGSPQAVHHDPVQEHIAAARSRGAARPRHFIHFNTPHVHHRSFSTAGGRSQDRVGPPTMAEHGVGDGGCLAPTL